MSQVDLQELSSALSKLGLSRRNSLGELLTAPTGLIPKAKRTKYIPTDISAKQDLFLSLTCRDVLYGGAAGGAKSYALFFAALQYVDVPGYAALLMRRTGPELTKSGGLVDISKKYLLGTDAKWNGTTHRWTFPTSGESAILELSNYQAALESGLFGQSGASYQYIGIDELTEFGQQEATFLFRSLRRPEGSKVPLRFRAGTNPIGKGAVWVKQYFITEGREKGRIFLPAKLSDNPYIDQSEYRKSLKDLPAHIRKQLEDGDWDAKPPGKMFRREWFPIVDGFPVDMPVVRFWDLAATEAKQGKDPDWTVGAKVGYDNGKIYIIDIKRTRSTPQQVEDLIFQTTKLDADMHDDYEVGMEEEGGASGKTVADYYMRKLNRWSFRPVRSTGSKELRARPLSAQAENGNVRLVRGPWINDFLDEMEQMPGGEHDDQCDSVASAYNMLVGDNEAAGDMDDVDTGGQTLPEADWDFT